MLDNNEQDLICSSCQTRFDENAHLPRMLPECGHTFCNQCLLQLLEKNDFIECPEDNIVSSRREVVSFPKNYSLLNILSKQKKKREHSSPLLNFEQNSSFSDKGSSSRKNSINQFQSYSSSMKNSMGDEDSSFQSVQLKKKCKDHKKEKDIVCLDCKEAICSNCALFGQHKKHDVASEEDVMKSISERAETLLQVYEELEEKSALINTSHYKEVIHNHLNQIKLGLMSEIEQQFKIIIKLVEEKKAKLIDELNKVIQNQEQISSNIVDLSKQNVLNEIEDWRKKAQEILQNLCDKSSDNELSFDLLQEKTKQKPDIIETGGKMLRQIIENNSAIQEKVKLISLQELKLDIIPNQANILDSLIKIKQIKDDKNPSNIKLQESLKHSEVQYKQSIRSDFRKRTQYKKTKKYLDDFYNQHRKEKSSHYPINNTEKILETMEMSEIIQDKQEDELIRQVENMNQQQIYNDNNIDEDDLKESLLIRQVSDVNDVLNLEGLQKSQVISNDFSYKAPTITKEYLEQQQMHIKNLPAHFYQQNENVKLCTDDDDENLISQINNKDFLLSQMLSYHNLSLNDINLLEEQIHTHEITGNPDVKKSILLSLARDNNLLSEDFYEDKFIEESTKQNNDQNLNKQLISIKEQAKFLNLVQEVFSNSIECVDFSNMELGDRGLEILSIALKENTSLNTVKLNKNKITDEGFIKLVDLIEHNCKNIETIYAQNNMVTDKSIYKLNELKKNPNCSIKNIYLNNNNIQDQKAFSIVQGNENKSGINISI